MKRIAFQKSVSALGLLTCGITACAPAVRPPDPSIPSMEYTSQLKNQFSQEGKSATFTNPVMFADRTAPAGMPAARASMHYVNDQSPAQRAVANSDVVTNENADFQTYESQRGNSRDYNGPLSLGDPGVTASLWRESRGSNDIFRDQRAWQPMDLITVIVQENSEGAKEADTEVKSSSAVQAAIDQLFTLDDQLKDISPNKIDPSNLVQASTSNEFKGEGETTRKGRLIAKISAMVAETLPSGILRIEGKKIITVNNEEQIMIISGLVRPRDINSNNEVDSSKIANMRVDYYGNGTVGEAQYGGWLGRLMRIIWPF